MALKVCSSCGKNVRINDEKCWGCHGSEFNSETVEGSAYSSNDINKPGGGVGDSIRCPKCGSQQFATGNKGFGLGKAAVGGLLLGPVGLLGGMIGSKKVKINCLKCGHSWSPGIWGL